MTGARLTRAKASYPSWLMAAVMTITASILAHVCRVRGGFEGRPSGCSADRASTTIYWTRSEQGRTLSGTSGGAQSWTESELVSIGVNVGGYEAECLCLHESESRSAVTGSPARCSQQCIRMLLAISIMLRKTTRVEHGEGSLEETYHVAIKTGAVAALPFASSENAISVALSSIQVGVQLHQEATTRV